MLQQKFKTPGDALAHHGVKGMKWGVRNEDESAPTSPLRNSEIGKEYVAALVTRKPPTPLQQKHNLAEAAKKSAEKLQPSENGDAKKGLSPNQKKALIGAGVVAGLLGAAYLAKSYGGGGAADLSSILPGRKVELESYRALSHGSRQASWADGFVNARSFSRPSFELPAGHTFHRISSSAEHSFASGTYASHSVEDLNRYIANMTGAKDSATTGLHHITWKSTAPIKVPSLTEVLETLKDNMGGNVSRDQVLREYSRISGGSWDDSDSMKLISQLTRKGYGAIVDEMDAGVHGESPIVFFSKNASKKSSEPLSSSAIKSAYRNLTEINNRK